MCTLVFGLNGFTLPSSFFFLCQALHKQGLANTDHTTLLLNCYTKLKDVSMLDEFIMVRAFRP